MEFTLRIDLDYVPWDTPDAKEYGHGEPAMVLKLLELARLRGLKLHFFASNRSMRAFPAGVEAVLNEGHDLDWLCKHPEKPQARFAESIGLFEGLGIQPLGMAVRGAYPSDAPDFPGLSLFRFLTAAPGYCPPSLTFFPLETRPLREGIRSGTSVRAWCDATKVAMREAASRNRSVIVAARPQVLAKHDPRLAAIREVLDLAAAIGLTPMTLRERLLEGDTAT